LLPHASCFPAAIHKGGVCYDQTGKATNAAIIVACVILVGSLARNYYLSRTPGPGDLPEIAKGEVVKLPGAASL
jgi:hypothetical protein